MHGAVHAIVAQVAQVARPRAAAYLGCRACRFLSRSARRCCRMSSIRAFRSAARLSAVAAWIMCRMGQKYPGSHCPFPYSICEYPCSNCQYPYSHCPYPYSMCQYPCSNCQYPYSHCPYPYSICQYPCSNCQYPRSHCPYPNSMCQYPYSNCQYPYSHCPYPYSMCQYPYSHYRRRCPSHSTAHHSAHARGSGGPSPGADVAGAAPHTCSLSDQVVPCLGHELLEHKTTKHNTTLS